MAAYCGQGDFQLPSYTRYDQPERLSPLHLQVISRDMFYGTESAYASLQTPAVSSTASPCYPSPVTGYMSSSLPEKKTSPSIFWTPNMPACSSKPSQSSLLARMHSDSWAVQVKPADPQKSLRARRAHGSKRRSVDVSRYLRMEQRKEPLLSASFTPIAGPPSGANRQVDDAVGRVPEGVRPSAGDFDDDRWPQYHEHSYHFAGSFETQKPPSFEPDWRQRRMPLDLYGEVEELFLTPLDLQDEDRTLSTPQNEDAGICVQSTAPEHSISRPNDPPNLNTSVAPNCSPAATSSALFSCATCKELFDTEKALEKHADFEDHRAFVCPERTCSHSCHRKALLDRHLAYHKAPKSYECTYCDDHRDVDAFKRQDALDVHMKRKHFKEWEKQQQLVKHCPYLDCEYGKVGFKFASRVQYRSHMANEHGQGKNDCPFSKGGRCKRSGKDGFKRKRDLEEHLKKVHRHAEASEVKGLEDDVLPAFKFS